MSEYTKEEIAKAKSWAIKIIRMSCTSPPGRNFLCDVDAIAGLLTALDSAEKDLKDVAEALQNEWTLELDRDKKLGEAEARCKELEARLEDAAEQAVEYCESNRLVGGWQDELRATIVGRKGK